MMNLGDPHQAVSWDSVQPGPFSLEEGAGALYIAVLNEKEFRYE
jgi:hypothetical protein